MQPVPGIGGAASITGFLKWSGEHWNRDSIPTSVRQSPKYQNYFCFFVPGLGRVESNLIRV